MIYFRPEYVCRAAFELFSVSEIIGLFGKGSFAPVDPSIQAEKWAVKVVRAAGQCFALVPLFPNVCNSIVVRVRQLPDAWRSGYIQRSVVPKAAFRKHHL